MPLRPRFSSLRRLAVVPLIAAALAAPAIAGDTGQLQFMCTVFLDVPAAFHASLDACRKVDPDSVPVLQSLFEQWQRTQAADQPRVRELVLGALEAQGTPEEVRQLVSELKTASAPGGPLIAGSFPVVSVRAFDCETLIPASLRGQDLMIKFHDYAAQWPAVH